jgi:hypothetical protein
MVECIPYFQKAVANPNILNEPISKWAERALICEWQPIPVFTAVIVILFFIGLWAYMSKKH